MRTKLLLFGITGDLSTRKLLPSLTHLLQEEEFADSLSVIGISRRQVDVAELLRSATGSDAYAHAFSIVTMDLGNPDDYIRLRETVNLQEDEQAVVYLSVPPEAATQIVELLGRAGLNGPNVKLLFEKPFGIDLASAEQTSQETARYFEEAQIYRVDHYAAKDMVQNIVPLRMGSPLLDAAWNKNTVERIEVVAYEELSIGERATFYEQVGALRDLIQGHLMQVLAVTLLAIPGDYEWVRLPELRLAALHQLHIADPHEAFRAQYEGYTTAAGNEHSQVETFASVTLHSSQPEWEGVPITLSTGKSLSLKTSEVRLHLRPTRDYQSNILKIRIQPNEGIETELMNKTPGYDQQYELLPWDFSYAQKQRIPDAYENVFVSAIRGEKSLFTTQEEILRSWEILAPIQAAWAAGDAALPHYPQGSDPEDVLQLEQS